LTCVEDLGVEEISPRSGVGTVSWFAVEAWGNELLSLE
jgi:hypothetical protein